MNKQLTIKSELECAIHPDFELQIGVYNRVVKQFNTGALSFKMSTNIKTPQGSGLGTSSTIVVSILGAFLKWQNIHLNNYDIAHLAFEIEREDETNIR